MPKDRSCPIRETALQKQSIRVGTGGTNATYIANHILQGGRSYSCQYFNQGHFHRKQGQPTPPHILPNTNCPAGETDGRVILLKAIRAANKDGRQAKPPHHIVRWYNTKRG